MNIFVKENTKMFIYLILIFLSFSNLNFVCGKTKIPIGGIFDDKNIETELAFRAAIDRINSDEKAFELVPTVEHVLEYDSYTTQRMVYKFGTAGVAAIFGPNSLISKGIVESMCDVFKIPHLIAQWEPEPLYTTIEQEECMMTINLFPDGNLFSKALADLIVDYSWKSFTIIYENDEGLIRMRDLLQVDQQNKAVITVRQLPEHDDYRPLFKEIQQAGEGHIILDCHPDKVVNILRQAQQVKMMEEYQSYVITSLNAQTIDFDDVKHMRANITTMTLFDQKDEELNELVDSMIHYYKRYNRQYQLSVDQVQTESVLMYDAVLVFASAVRELFEDEIDDENPFSVDEINFSEEEITPWDFGPKLMSYMKNKMDRMSIKGLTGDIGFDDLGHRTNFHLDIVELSKNGFKKIGGWVPDTGIIYTRSAGEVDSLIIESLQNKTVIVVSRIGAPFLMYRQKKDGESFEGNTRFEGYSVDLIDGISKILKFNYRFELVPDGKYGSFNKETKQWDGLVRHLLDRKADLAICDLTITYERRTAVDFTMPFMTLGFQQVPLKKKNNKKKFCKKWNCINSNFLEETYKNKRDQQGAIIENSFGKDRQFSA